MNVDATPGAIHFRAFPLALTIFNPCNETKARAIVLIFFQNRQLFQTHSLLLLGQVKSLTVETQHLTLTNLRFKILNRFRIFEYLHYERKTIIVVSCVRGALSSFRFHLCLKQR